MPDALAENLKRLTERIARSCERAGRGTRAVRMVAASKTVPAGTLRRLAALGCADFGENRIQEALPKMDALADLPIVWHFIGRLQRNKAKFVPGRFAWVHSIDSLELARELSHRAQAASRPVRCLIEANLSGEPRKGGLPPDGLGAFLEAARDLPLLSFDGLMTMAPYGASEKNLRELFSRARGIATALRLSELSMGMSGDFEIAVEEGATFVRIGRALFGERPLVPRGTI